MIPARGQRRRNRRAHRTARSFSQKAFARAALAGLGKWTLEIVKRSDSATGFMLLLRRWVVERTLAWLNRNRRLAKDFEATIASAQAWIYIVSVKLLSRRLTRV
jgi:transposase